ncbi:MAG: hypothetical protein GY841_09605 [FCB group bacterium]|nr:hypothetical protein [FCB group bacterium]
MEYQLLSQEYYDAVIDTSQSDLIESWYLTKDEINDLIYRTIVDYRHKNQKTDFSLLGNMEYSTDRLLGRVESFFSLGDYNRSLKLFGKYENKSVSENGDQSYDDAYDYFQTYLKARRRISSRMRLQFKAGYETVNFDSKQPDDTSSFINYDYSIVSSRLSGDLSLNEFSKQLFWAISYHHRQVPDSQEAAYDDFRFLLDYSNFDLNGQLGLEVELEHKNYSRADSRYDFTALFFRGRFGRSIGHNIEWDMNFDLDNYQYSTPDIINRNYNLIKIKIQALRQPADWGIGPFARLEFRSEEELDIEAEEYSQWELGLTGNILNITTLFFDSELSVGKRNYNDGNSILTSYSFVSISTMVNIRLLRFLSLNLAFDGDFESHDQWETDSDLYLLSAGLNARF